jgi:hypothetical protein
VDDVIFVMTDSYRWLCVLDDAYQGANNATKDKCSGCFLDKIAFRLLLFYVFVLFYN